MKKTRSVKLVLSGGLAVLALLALILPVVAGIGGSTDIVISSKGSGGPDIDVSSNGTFVAVTYFRQQTGAGAVFVKSATQASGWVTAKFVGTGKSPQLAFSSNTAVFVVWVNDASTAIQAASCTLSATNLPVCTTRTNVTTTATPILSSPDVMVNGNNIHVAWQESGAIKSKVSINGGTSWSAEALIATGGNFDQSPVLAFSNNRLHVAFLRGASSSLPTSVQYRFSTNLTTPHNWSSSQSFAIGAGISSLHDRLGNPSLAANGNNVFLAFDAHRTSTNNFSLIFVMSSNNGGAWTSPAHSPSGNSAASTAEDKPSSASGVPIQETGLRSSIAISGTTGTSSALTWQQVSGAGCLAFQPSDIYYTTPVLPATGSAGILNNPSGFYRVDPDLAVYTTTGHVAFMKDASGTPCGGDAGDYIIAYQGPFTIQNLDQGEEGGRAYLPIITR